MSIDGGFSLLFPRPIVKVVAGHNPLIHRIDPAIGET